MRAAVAQAFTSNTLTAGVSPDELSVTDVRLAGIDPRWELISLGGRVDIACDVAPKDVLDDLALDCSGPGTTSTSGSTTSPN